MNGSENIPSGNFETVPVEEILRERFFTRDLLRQGERSLIRSVCRRCGTVIVGSVMDNLTTDELQHAQVCSLRN